MAEVPTWGWWTLACLLLAPLYLRYVAWTLGGCAEFWAPGR